MDNGGKISDVLKIGVIILTAAGGTEGASWWDRHRQNLIFEGRVQTAVVDVAEMMKENRQIKNEILKVLVSCSEHVAGVSNDG